MIYWTGLFLSIKSSTAHFFGNKDVTVLKYQEIKKRTENFSVLFSKIKIISTWKKVSRIYISLEQWFKIRKKTKEVIPTMKVSIN